VTAASGETRTEFTLPAVLLEVALLVLKGQVTNSAAIKLFEYDLDDGSRVTGFFDNPTQE